MPRSHQPQSDLQRRFSVAEIITPRVPSRALIERYLREIRRSQSRNSVNFAHIRLERRMTPLERAAIHSASRRSLSPVERWLADARPLRSLVRRLPENLLPNDPPQLAHVDWLLRWTIRRNLSGQANPEPWSRRISTRGFALYSRQPRIGASTRLLLAWTGGSKLMMLPTPDFLQAARSFDGDVLFLWEDRHDAFMSGISGLGTDFESSVSALRELVNQWGYRSIVNMGGSLGALPALAATWTLAPDRSIILGPLDPEKFAGPLGWDELEKQSKKSAHQGLRDRISVYFGGASDKDRRIAQLINHRVGVRVVEVKDVNHGILYPLLQRRELDRWIQQVLAR